MLALALLAASFALGGLALNSARMAELDVDADARARLVAWAERHGLPYREVGFLEGYRDVKRFMDGAWDVEPEAPADPRGEPRAAPLALAAVSGPR